MFLFSKLPCLWWRSHDFLRSFPKNICKTCAKI
jgi:hypothetical protein